jgi:hypothetical protein
MVSHAQCPRTLVVIMVVSCLLSRCAGDNENIRNDTFIFHVIRIHSNNPNLFTDVE